MVTFSTLLPIWSRPRWASYVLNIYTKTPSIRWSQVWNIKFLFPSAEPVLFQRWRCSWQPSPQRRCPRRWCPRWRGLWWWWWWWSYSMWGMSKWGTSKGSKGGIPRSGMPGHIMIKSQIMFWMMIRIILMTIMMMLIMRIQLLFKPFGIWDLMSSRMSLMYWSILSSSTASL